MALPRIAIIGAIATPLMLWIPEAHGFMKIVDFVGIVGGSKVPNVYTSSPNNVRVSDSVPVAPHLKEQRQSMTVPLLVASLVAALL